MNIVLITIAIIIVVILGLGVYPQFVSAYYIETKITPWHYDKIKDGILTYNIESNDTIFQKLVRDAFLEWQKKLKHISFTEIKIPESWFGTNISNNFVDITVKQVPSLKLYKLKENVAGTTEATYDIVKYFDYTSQINILMPEDIVEMNDEAKYTTLLHEIGHALGLVHPNDEVSLMSYQQNIIGIVSECDVYFVFIANQIYNKDIIDTAKKEGCDLVYKYNDNDDSIQYVNTIEYLFKIKFPSNLQKISDNLVLPTVLKLIDTPIPGQFPRSIFQVDIFEYDETEITLENFEELYPNYISELIKKKIPNHTILDSQITLLKNHKIHKMAFQDSNFTNILITIPIDDYRRLYFQGMYHNGDEMYFLSLFNSILSSIELIETIGPSPNNEELIDTIINKGHTLSIHSRFDEALKYYDKALEIDPANATLLYIKGIVLGRLEKYEEAIKYYDKALEIFPSNINILASKAIALTKLNKNQEALPLIKRVIQYNPNSSFYQNTAILIMYNLGNYSDAKSYYDEVLKSNLLKSNLYQEEFPQFHILTANNAIIQKRLP